MIDLILTLNEAKDFLRLETDYSDEDTFITTLTIAAEKYIQNATGKTFNSTNELYKLALKMLISHWYSKREVIGKADLLAYSLGAILFQLQYCEV